MAETEVINAQEVAVQSHSIFTLDDIDPAKRFEVWRDSINCIFDVDAEKEKREEGFHATLETDVLGSIMMVETTSVAQKWARKESHVARDGMDHYMIQLFRDGKMREDKDCHRVRDVETENKLVVFDLSRPVETFTSDFQNLSLILPRSFLEDALHQPDDHHMRVLDQSNGLSNLLKDMMLSLHKNIRHMPLSEAPNIQNMLLDLVSSALNSDGGTGSSHAGQHKLHKIVEIKRYIAMHLFKADLSPESICRDLGVSRSKLYKLFENVGGIVSYIRNARMRHAIKVLTNTNNVHRSLYDIALECGYTTDSAFIRAFKRTFGVSPGAVRSKSYAQERRDGLGVFDIIDKRYEKWLHQLT